MKDQTGSEKQLLVLAPPIVENEYYQEKYSKVIPFYKRYVDAIRQGTDDVVLVIDEKSYPDYTSIPPEVVIVDHIDDPWVRDVSTPIPSRDVQFTYVGGSTLKEATNTQKFFDKFIKKNGIVTTKTDLLLDGGNLVNNNKDAVITTRKFLTDNHLSEQEGVEELKHLMNVKHVSILTPDEPKLAHSDGMAAYVCDDVIYQHKQGEAEFNAMVRKELLKGCPHCEIVEVEGFLDDKEYKEGYASSCGVYVNCVVTGNYIYVPQFGGKHADKDAEALALFADNRCGKTAIPIDVSEVCVMGGSLRCLSWQTSGAIAQKFREAPKVGDGYEGSGSYEQKKDTAERDDLVERLDQVETELEKIQKSISH